MKGLLIAKIILIFIFLMMMLMATAASYGIYIDLNHFLNQECLDPIYKRKSIIDYVYANERIKYPICNDNNYYYLYFIGHAGFYFLPLLASVYFLWKMRTILLTQRFWTNK